MQTDIAILPANYDLWTTLGVQTDPFPWYLNVPLYFPHLRQSQMRRGSGL